MKPPRFLSSSSKASINAGESDYSAVITKLKAANVDFVYYGGLQPELGLLLRQAREQGLKAVFMGPEGVADSAWSPSPALQWEAR